jgi:hypothetical protein
MHLPRQLPHTCFPSIESPLLVHVREPVHCGNGAGTPLVRRRNTSWQASACKLFGP